VRFDIESREGEEYKYSNVVLLVLEVQPAKEWTGTIKSIIMRKSI
jgi:hypothetical protein